MLPVPDNFSELPVCEQLEVFGKLLKERNKTYYHTIERTKFGFCVTLIVTDENGENETRVSSPIPCDKPLSVAVDIGRSLSMMLYACYSPYRPQHVTQISNEDKTAAIWSTCKKEAQIGAECLMLGDSPEQFAYAMSVRLGFFGVSPDYIKQVARFCWAEAQIAIVGNTHEWVSQRIKKEDMPEKAWEALKKVKKRSTQLTLKSSMESEELLDCAARLEKDRTQQSQHCTPYLGLEW